MSKRKCDSCGKEKKVKGGKVCTKSHFICYSCVNVSVFSTRKTCPICSKKLK